MNKIFAVFILALPLAACGAGSTLDSIGTAVTTTVANPVTSVNIYQVKNAYAAADTLVINYRRYCWARPYTTLMADPIASPVCKNRRAVVLTAQDAGRKASAAITVASNFVKKNPTLNAASLISAAWSAVGDYKAAVPTVPQS